MGYFNKKNNGLKKKNVSLPWTKRLERRGLVMELGPNPSSYARLRADNNNADNHER